VPRGQPGLIRSNQERTAMLGTITLMLASLPAARAYARPDPGLSLRLGSGIISSDGSGTRALGNQPNLGVTTRVGPAR